MNSSNKVILNTIFLYGNMVVSVCVQFYAVRLVFNALGEVDYGIYNIVAGVVALFAFMNVAMSAATQRYLSYAIGEKNMEKLKETFYYSVVLHLIVGIIALVLLEIGGIYYIDNILDAPEERLYAARMLLHCITISTFINIITVPYEADINANENMGVIATINILDSLMKLGTAIFILYTSYDKLQIFGVLTMTSMCITLLIKRFYCMAKYPEAKFKIHKISDTKQMRAIASFAMWNLIGSGCSISRYQGTAMILNFFKGISVNAAYGIAQQVNGLLNFFANTIVRAIRPQIVKSEGGGDRERMLRLSVTTCKITSLMIALLSVPLFIEMDFVLSLWLGKTPSPESIVFCQCFLVIVFINQLTIGLQIAIESEGHIKLLQSVVGTMHLLALPAGFLCYKLIPNCSPAAIMYCIIVEELVALITRTVIAKRITKLDNGAFIRKTVLPCMALILADWSVCYYSSALWTNKWAQLIWVTCLSCAILCSVSYFFILTNAERMSINSFVAKGISKIKR